MVAAPDTEVDRPTLDEYLACPLNELPDPGLPDIETMTRLLSTLALISRPSLIVRLGTEGPARIGVTD